MGLDVIRAYHFGSRYIVEMEVVLPADMSVQDSHDISLDLQHKVERELAIARATSSGSGRDLLAVIIQMLHDFSKITEVQPLQEAPKSQAMQLLLLFMALHDASGSSNLSSASSGPTTPANMSLADNVAVEHLLQLVQWVSIPLPVHANAMQSIESDLHAFCSLGGMVNATLTASEAFGAACKLLQGCPASCCAGSSGNIRGRTAASWPGPAATMGKILRDAYGWTGSTNPTPEQLPGPSTSAVAYISSCSSRSHGSTARRDTGSLYDSYMLELLFSMLPAADDSEKNDRRGSERSCSRGLGFPKSQAMADESSGSVDTIVKSQHDGSLAMRRVCLVR
eukprot:gene2281-2592_t